MSNCVAKIELRTYSQFIAGILMTDVILERSAANHNGLQQRCTPVSLRELFDFVHRILIADEEGRLRSLDATIGNCCCWERLKKCRVTHHQARRMEVPQHVLRNTKIHTSFAADCRVHLTHQRCRHRYPRQATRID